MPIRDYGVWKATPVQYTVEHNEDDSISPHLSLYFDDSGEPTRHASRNVHRSRSSAREIPGLFRAAINIKSGDRKESRLAYWVNHNFNQHPKVNDLTDLPLGFHPLGDRESGTSSTGLNLDFIRDNLFCINDGRILPHDIEGPNNDMIDVLEPEVKQAIDKKAEIYLFGSRFNTQDGIHNIHMNQGNTRKFKKDDGVFQDGGILINYPDSGEWVGVFLGFASQAVHTDDKTGHAITSETWEHYLDSERQPADLTENSVRIKEALVAPLGPDGLQRRSVTLTNPTDHTMPLSRWKIHNSAGQSQALPKDAALGAMSTGAFSLPNCPLASRGDTITLVNDQGLKVDGVSYCSQKKGIEGRPVVFAH
ncbi:uncharacterized protein N7503_006253 [Penicillium pulvis]|uniref:uncharacterized protein n=1 Tax=Penicillium pulvis TaxID=1562058 RepID=UPI002548CA0E|nr:uncharacterized protein N7503_006253 [Penicillium pulvis]KAJ5798748.1 hypothetical protein N7503_006253 [Penicillium pulvis]